VSSAPALQSGDVPQIRQRDVSPRASYALEQAGVHPLLARLLAGRGVRAAEELDDSLARLLPPAELLGASAAGRLLADALATQRRICVVADYDCDGATACAVALRGLALLGAAPGTLAYVVPDRAVHGYGLTPAIVDLALAQTAPELLVTVDNGIASLDGVAHARAWACRCWSPTTTCRRWGRGARYCCRRPRSSSTPTSPAAASAARPSPGWA
jgi:single-stranded-DNA-specific exonuclease